MPPADPDADSSQPGSPLFATTHWSVVLAAGGDSSSAVRDALEKLCRAYWYPLYAFVRRQGIEVADAQDLTQEFFARLLSRNDLARVRREKGRFRSFLLASLKHFLTNEWKRARRLKRGGGQTIVPLDSGDAETRFGHEPAHDLTPEKLFERRWALTLLDSTLTALRREHEDAGKTRQFDELKIFLTGGDGLPSYAEVGDRLNVREDAVKMAVSRLRKRYRELLRAEIAHTVSSPAEIDDELRQLFAALT